MSDSTDISDPLAVVTDATVFYYWSLIHI